MHHIVRALGAVRSSGRSPLFQTVLQLLGPALAVDAVLETLLSARRQVQFDLVCDLRHLAGGGIGGLLIYDSALFEASSAERLSAQLLRVLRGALDAPSGMLRSVPLMGAAERGLVLYGFNATAEPLPGACVHEVFEARAWRSPGTVALELESVGQVSCASLHLRARVSACMLCAAGVVERSPVPLLAARGLPYVAGMLGVLLARAAFVPIDLSYPAQRIAWMLEDIDAAVIGLVEAGEGLLPAGITCTLVRLDVPSGFSAFVGEPCLLSDVAFVIFTSGTTGRPKGSLNHHKGLLNNILGWLPVGLTQQDMIFQFSSLSFDVSVRDFFFSLCYGAALFLRDDTTHWTTALARSHACCLNITPSALAVVGTVSVTALRHVVLAGEALSLQQAKLWLSAGVHTYNAYGPSECSIDSTQKLMSLDDAAVTLGQPMANVSVLILDGRLEPSPVCVAAELYVGGVGVSYGYLKRPGLTSSCFITNPHGTDKLYKSGDLARWTAGGEVAFIGRVDEQVKLRGQRVELGEIEAAALASGVAVEAAAIVQTVNRRQELLLYASPSALDVRQLLIYLGERLPRYMVPSERAVTRLERLPLTANGKLSRRALPLPELIAGETSAEVEGELEPTLRLVLDALHTSLSMPRVPGADVPLIELGVDSLFGIALSQELSTRTSRPLPATLLFDHPSAREVALYLQQLTYALAASQSPSPTSTSIDKSLNSVWSLQQPRQSSPILSTFELICFFLFCDSLLLLAGSKST